MRRPLLALSLATLLALPPSPARAQKISDPDLYGKSLYAAYQALEAYGRWDDTEEHRRLLDIGYRLAERSGYRDFPFTFYLIDMPVPNAFALPGGQIFITRGMMRLGLDDDMLAGLLGHEIGHVTRRHGMRMQKRATLLNVLSSVLLVGVLVQASQSDNRRDPDDPYSRPTNTVEGAAATGIVVSELLLRSYSRTFEDEADVEGQRMASAAGFSPDGTRRLMATMEARMPQTQEYGYWQTHPFFEERVQAAEARESLFHVAEPTPSDEYRRATQDALLRFAEDPPEPELEAFLQVDALAVWPIGPKAEHLRLARVHEARDALLAEPELSRDFGELIALYETHSRDVAELTPESSLLDTLEEERGELERQRDALHPRFLEVFEGGVYQADFLETFVSNFPAAADSASVSLALGQVYARLGRPADAVDHLLAAATGGDGETARKARNGLLSLATVMKDLSALQRLADYGDDAEIAELAGRRLQERAAAFSDLAEGASYLEGFSDRPLAETITERQNRLAENLYGEVVLYQTVGEETKAVEGIQRILEHAPLSPASRRLRDQAVYES